MTIEEKIQNALQPTVEGMGFVWWGMEYLPAGRHTLLRIFIEKEDGTINSDETYAVCKQISAVLDVEDIISSEFRLEVSSPGMDRLLFTPEQFERYQGSEVQVRSSIAVLGRKRFKGIMTQVTESGIELEVDGEIYPIEFDLIEKANVVPKF
ncbi:ribosome maturation factor RimP [Thiomicrorhabdus sediminis]|uniref:Ribosome maturation factor RimP n=1 Tax=Thiomicrorhabdus sediminis TaxID=2580412 RepID=A0A4P9K5J7_9GAMM|nr:ribosome maturation factor RimP [Thiomicrorhabdus sediminis]QCU90275.1 ribosome maturation factor RimP [Thiomicrorhabdus sediminis]